MTEFSCEFCKAEFKDNSTLQRHIKTSKKCISKRTPKRDEARDSVSLVASGPPNQVEETDLMAKYTQALKKIEEQKYELAHKEGVISYFRGKDKQPNNKTKKDAVYEVNMFCMCGMLAYMKETNMEELLDETIVEQFKVNPNKYERTIVVAITKKD